VVRALKNAILSGRYRPGGLLPSARDLSDELKVNKNTVTKACRQLQTEGLLRIAPGRRAIIENGSDLPHRDPQTLIEEQLKRILSPILREARLLGISAGQMLQMLTNEIASFQLGTARRMYLFECNRLEAEQHARAISEWLAVDVGWKLLDELPGFTLRASDIFVVPYYHLDDVAPHLPSHQIAGIHVAPDPEVLFTLIEAAQRGKVALICGNPKSAARFRKLLQYYTNKGIRITHHGDVKSMKALFTESRTVFATPAAFFSVEQHLRAKPILFPERIDPQSLHLLRVLLNQTQPAPGPAEGPATEAPSSHGDGQMRHRRSRLVSRSG
jgi:GntR family transcriptional regulator